jgi:prolyl oligopeptidase
METYSRRIVMRLSNIAAALMLALAVSAIEPPPTERDDVTEVVHGVELVDPYRWLEGGAAPELDERERADLEARVSEWTDAQNLYTRHVLDNLPGREKLESRLQELMEVGSVGTPTMRRDLYFYTKREGDQPQPVVYVRRGVRGDPRVLLDPNALDSAGLTALAWTAPNRDGSLMAFGLYRAGDENATLYILDVESGEWLADEIPGKVQEVNWMPDGKSFFYSRLGDVGNPYSREIRYHVVGTHHRQDPRLFEQYSEGPLATTWGPFAYTSRDGRWMILGYWTGTDSNDLWVADLDQWFRTGELDLVEILEGEEAQASGPIVGDTLYMHTTLGAPNRRLVAVDLNRPAREHWKEVIPERRDAVLESIASSRSFLVAGYLRDARNEVVLHDFDGRVVRRLELPGIGTASVSTDQERNEVFLRFVSFNEPPSIYHVDLRKGERELWERPDVPVDPAMMEVRQVFFRSKDGTRVPMFLVHRKGLTRNGENPTWLTGYGGFNVSRKPFFSATLFPWLESGGIYAVVNLRGGGEYGTEWHRAGMLDRKQNVFDDFIAAAEYLISEKYTSPRKLAITGGSNGGLLTGAALVQRPDLFAAVISAVPLLDMLRYQHFLMARFWVPEYGTAENPEHFDFLHAYSPYHNVEEGTTYPAVMLTAGENDARVHPLHARKMTALLQASTASDPAEAPVLLWVDREAGHGQGKPLHLRVRDTADQRLFLMWQLGMLGDR